ncbi:uncharacterized protein LOC121266746 isoform X2 [Juglans microcarpa x Juglans regia]|uniref:uncharacterized protein LOC121266746 isoform X2 n=1 Tax=Juglans microcarpa x Juglans regia TaxID=2249226 RepID=UPI001B7DD4E8|nr:uncharacterized protein LOC121266746 isoform X2 [Juglans microcarpa x Juglans regia]
MGERKLNFGAPLLSVRRFSSPSASENRRNRKIIEYPLPDRQLSLPFYQSELDLNQVTDDVAVPFHWEKIPGRAKDGSGPEPLPSEEASVTPRFPPARFMNITKLPSEKECGNTNSLWGQIVPYTSTDKECSREGINEKGGLGLEDNDDVYSDAHDTLSPTNSFSMNYSASGLSGSDGPDVKPSGTFSTDPQTLDFMMSRFLPAARAMTLEPPRYASRKQGASLEQPRKVNRVASEDRWHLLNQNGSNIIPLYGQNEDEEESEDDDDEYGNNSAKGCGPFPGLWFKNSLCLLSPMPGMKVRTLSHESSTREIVRPSKTVRSQSQIVQKHGWNAVDKSQSDYRVRSGELQKVDKKRNGEYSRLTCSGELQTLGRSSTYTRSQGAGVSPYRNEAPQSPFLRGELQKVDKKRNGEYSRLTCSGELQTLGRSSPYTRSQGAGVSPYRNEAPQSPFRSGELQKFDKKQNGEYSRLTGSGELQTLGRSSPYTRSQGAGISPYRNEAPQSPFRSGELQKFDKKQNGEYSRLTGSGELQTLGRSSPYTRSQGAGISPYRNEAPQSPFRSGELQKVDKKWNGEYSQLTHSGELQTLGRSSPYTRSQGAGVSPYRNEAPQSPFRSVSFLGLPKEIETFKANRFSLCNEGSNKNKQRSGPMSSAVEKTLYVDTVNNAKLSFSNSSSSVTQEWIDSAHEDLEKSLERRGSEDTTNTESIFQDIKCLNISNKGATLDAFVSVDADISSLSAISHPKGQEVTIEDSGQNQGIDRRSSLECSKLTTVGNLNISSDQILKADGPGNADASSVSIHPPLPKSPSDSWLWRTLPSLPSISSRKQEYKTSSTNTKWEAIVKSSHLHHDHVRYSEELITHIPATQNLLQRPP